jgi:hypothetical protein
MARVAGICKLARFGPRHDQKTVNQS